MNVDRKFRILAVNATSGTTYTEADCIILLAKDKATPAALSAYRDKCIELGSNPEHIGSVELLMTRVALYQDQHGSKVCETLGAEIPRCLAEDFYEDPEQYY